MIRMTAMKRLAICLLNISEGRNAKIVESVASAAVSSSSASQEISSDDNKLGLKCQSTVLNIFSDYDYNRSVLTIAAPLHHLSQSVYNACREAYRQVDMSKQCGGHPRLGAVDLLPIYPLSGDVSLEECGALAREIASNLARDVPGSSFFLFGSADLPNNTDLVARRKQVGWFLGNDEMDYSTVKHDIGSKPSARYGLTGVGASLYVTNYNVTINTKDVSIGHDISKRIRSTTPGGLPGVRVMAFAHRGKVEIACNVEHFSNDKTKDVPHKTNEEKHTLDNQPDRSTYKDVCYTSPAVIEARVKVLAEEQGVTLEGSSVIGFTPQEAYELAVHALQTGKAEFWRTRKPGTMM
ncbi:glutamate formimidoyltransferase-like [Asterias amurensis]|uniref:glutamate formimidoyltransferase-like n=1 Tax=Asterias amurensis TaxID=7602 RepID=UPI003AB7E4C3